MALCNLQNPRMHIAAFHQHVVKGCCIDKELRLREVRVLSGGPSLQIWVIRCEGWLFHAFPMVCKSCFSEPRGDLVGLADVGRRLGCRALAPSLPQPGLWASVRLCLLRRFSPREQCGAWGTPPSCLPDCSRQACL